MIFRDSKGVRFLSSSIPKNIKTQTHFQVYQANKGANKGARPQYVIAAWLSENKKK